MVQSLTLDVIRSQKQAAIQRREELFAEMAEIKELIEDCEASERMLSRVNETIKTATIDLLASLEITHAVTSASLPINAGPYRPETNKYYIWQCLQKSQNRWLTAVEIRRIASHAKREEIPMSSISPMINAMMKEGHVVRDGLKVALKERVKTNNPATEAAGS